ncbi:MAG: M56 family metallopeptidase [Mucilaginibacter sp.]
MNWLHYFLEANIYLTVFYLLYNLLLSNETHYKLNRIYLLTTCIIAYIIPFFQLGFLKPAIDEGATVTAVIINPIANSGTLKAAEFSWHDLLIYGYLAGAAVTLVIFSIKIAKLLRMTRAEKHLMCGRYKLIYLENSNTAFSFFNYVFIGTNLSAVETVIRHEVIHISHKHSADIVFLELFKAMGWFNPFIYLLQRSLKSVHEYIADEQAAAFENDTLAYSSLLVNNAYGLGGSSITHSFFNYNLLKKRIIMLNKKRSGNLARLKYLTALPLCVGLLCASTLGFAKTYGVINIAPQQVTDTTKLQIVDVEKAPEKPVEIRQQINQAIKEEISKQKKIDLKQAQSPDKVREIKIVPIKDSGKSADLIKEMPSVSTDANSEVFANNQRVTDIHVHNQDKGHKIMEAGKKSQQLIQVKLLPTPANPLDSFYRYIGRYVRYPKSARDGHISGKVICEFEVADGKINNPKLARGVNADLDAEALRVLKNYSGDLKLYNGTYDIPITFLIVYKNAKVAENPADKNSGGQAAPGAVNNSAVRMLNEVVVTTFVN